MSPVSITLSFPSLEAAHNALSGMLDRINYRDRPDVGSELSPLPAPAVPVKVDGSRNPFAVDTTLEQGGAVAIPGVPANPTLTAPSIVSTRAPAAVPAPPDSAPIPPSAATAPIAAPGVELDSAGLPWDGRIHGSTKTKNADGSWRQKRGLNDPALKQRVETELHAGQAARAPAGLAAVAAVPPAPAGLPAAVPTAPPAALAADPYLDGITRRIDRALDPAAPVTETFGALMARLAPMVMTDAAAAVKINAVLAQYGLQSLAQLGARPDLVAQFGTHADAALAVA